MRLSPRQPRRIHGPLRRASTPREGHSRLRTRMRPVGKGNLPLVHLRCVGTILLPEPPVSSYGGKERAGHPRQEPIVGESR